MLDGLSGGLRPSDYGVPEVEYVGSALVEIWLSRRASAADPMARQAREFCAEFGQPGAPIVDGHAAHFRACVFPVPDIQRLITAICGPR